MSEHFTPSRGRENDIPSIKMKAAERRVQRSVRTRGRRWTKLWEELKLQVSNEVMEIIHLESVSMVTYNSLTQLPWQR